LGGATGTGRGGDKTLFKGFRVHELRELRGHLSHDLKKNGEEGGEVRFVGRGAMKSVPKTGNSLGEKGEESPGKGCHIQKGEVFDRTKSHKTAAVRRE